MAGQIFHEWNGTVLTITSDSGTSSADLKGVGEMGPRGPQGPAGVSVGEGGSVDLSNYYTKDETYSKTEVDEKIAAIPEGETADLSNYYTKTETDQKIAEAQLGGEGGDVDLSNYRTLDNNVFSGVRVTDPEYGFINIWSNGIEGPDDKLWIDNQGNGYFSTLSIGTSTDNKPVATQEWVTTAIANALAALDGSEVEY